MFNFLFFILLSFQGFASELKDHSPVVSECHMTFGFMGELYRLVYEVDDKDLSSQAIFDQLSYIKRRLSPQGEHILGHLITPEDRPLFKEAHRKLADRVRYFTKEQLTEILYSFLAFDIQPSREFKEEWWKRARKKELILNPLEWQGLEIHIL